MDAATKNMVARFLSEFIATFLLVMLGCMGCIKGEKYENSHMQLTLNFGLVILIAVQCFHTVTGPHMNPAITLAALIYERVTPTMTGMYIVAQCLGAFLGYGTLTCLVPEHVVDTGAEHKLCVTHVNSDINLTQAFVIEFIITMVLIWVCCAIWDPKNSQFFDSVSVRFGLAIACLACTAGAFTGASMNPARSIGPAVWQSDYKDQWLYWVAPLTGAVFGAFVFKFMFKSDDPNKVVASGD